MEVVRGGVTGWDLTNELKRTLLAHGAALVDVERCYETQCSIMYAQTGLREDLCGKCFAVCAYTRGYLKRSVDESAPPPA